MDTLYDVYHVHIRQILIIIQSAWPVHPFLLTASEADVTISFVILICNQIKLSFIAIECVRL